MFTEQDVIDGFLLQRPNAGCSSFEMNIAMKQPSLDKAVAYLVSQNDFWEYEELDMGGAFDC